MGSKVTHRNAAETKAALRNFSKATGLWQVVILYSFKGEVKKFPTGLRVPESYWNELKEEVKSGGVDDVLGANTHIKTIKAQLDGIIRRSIQDTGAKPSLEVLEAEYEKLTKVDSNPSAVLESLAAYTVEKAQTVRANSLKAYRAVHNNLVEYQQVRGKVLRFDTISLGDVQDFERFLTDEKAYLIDTVIKRLKTLKTFLSEIENLPFNPKLIRPAHKAKRIYDPVTLNRQELEALMALEFPTRKGVERARDLFLLQCWCGLRYSDLMRLERQHIKNGIIRLDITKTDEHSNIPLFPVAKQILEKYNYKLPRLSNVQYNQHIKEACQMVPALQVSVGQAYFIGKIKSIETRPKCQWISSHTARRTMISLALELDTPVHYVMRWSGHKDMQSFQRYLNAAQGEKEAAANMIAKYNNLVGTDLKVA